MIISTDIIQMTYKGKFFGFGTYNVATSLWICKV